METREWTTIDRAALGWPSGQWDGEPDKVQCIKGRRLLPYRSLCLAYKIGVPADVLLQTRKSKKAYEDRQAAILAGEIKEPA